MAVSKIQSSPYSPIYPTNPVTGNLIVETIGGGEGGGSITPVVRTPNIIITTTSGTITTGAKSISIANSGNANGTVKGVVFPTGVTVSWDAPYPDTLGPVAYDATGTTYIISEVR